MRADSNIQYDVEREIRWDPAIESRDIGVSVRNRVVTLTGIVRSFTERHQAEQDAKRVAGVAAIANELEVRLPAPDLRSDSDLAQDAVLALVSQVPYLSGVTPPSSELATSRSRARWRGGSSGNAPRRRCAACVA